MGQLIASMLAESNDTIANQTKTMDRLAAAWIMGDYLVTPAF